MDIDLLDNNSDCSSDVSETQSELEARIYSVIHHNDFSGTTEAPFVDPKYGVEFNSNGEVVVYIKDVLDSQIDHFDYKKLTSCDNRVIPTILLDDDGDDNVVESSQDIMIVENEFIETSLKKRKKKKKKKKVQSESIQKYIELMKNSNILKEYRVESKLDEMNTKKGNEDNLAMNVGFQNERAMPMTRNEVLRQYRIGKPTEDTTWYRCPKTWTSDMVTFYTKIQKSKRNYDCAEELKKIRETQGSNPIDWALDSSDLCKSYLNIPRIKCNYCRQYGHKAFNCKEQYKPEVCIMCGLEGHNFNSCDKQLCFTCGKRQNTFTNNCSSCISKSRIKCNKCNDYGHESKFCTESWRQYHNIVSTETGPNDYQNEQSTSTCQLVTIGLSKTKNTKSTSQPVMIDLSKTKNKKLYTKVGHDNETSTKSTPNECSKKKKKRFKTKKNRKKAKHNNNKTFDKESVDIKINIQDVTLKRTLTKTGFLKNKKMKC